MMLASITLLFAASSVLASAHQGRNHVSLAKRVANDTSTLEKRDTYTNVELTWYPTDTGPDACTGKNHLSSDWFVAMEQDQFNAGGCCGKQLTLNYNGKTAVATCVDSCASCYQWGQLDLTEGLFTYLVGDPGIGEVFASWSYTGDNDDQTTTKQAAPTTTHKASTTHTTTTHKATPTTTKETPTTTARPSSSSAKVSSSAVHSSSESSSVKLSSSAEAVSSTLSSTSAVPTVSQAVAANAGAGPQSASDTDGTTDKPITGGLGTGSDSSAISLSFNKFFCVAALAVLGLQLA